MNFNLTNETIAVVFISIAVSAVIGLIAWNMNEAGIRNTNMQKHCIAEGGQWTYHDDSSDWYCKMPSEKKEKKDDK